MNIVKVVPAELATLLYARDARLINLSAELQKVAEIGLSSNTAPRILKLTKAIREVARLAV